MSSSIAKITAKKTSSLADSIAPTVLSFSPADGATDVALGANLTFTFSEAIQRGNGLLLLMTASGSIAEMFNAATSTRLGFSGNTLTIDPTANLLAGTQYYLIPLEGTVTDLAGNRYGGTSAYDFRTIYPDTTAPTVTRFAPTDGATGVELGANLSLSFSEAVKRGTGSIMLKTAAGTLVESFDAASSPRISIAGATLTVDPSANLANGIHYYLSFAAGTVKDLAGNAYAGSNSYDFTTVRDTSAPTVTAFAPTDGATGVALGANLSLSFSEAVQRGTGSIVLKTAAGALVESFSAASSSRISIAGSTLTVDPSANLANGTHYYLSFAAGTVKDLAGNAYAGSNTYDFTTVPDTSAPTVSAFAPTDGATGVALGANLSLSFSEAVQRGTGSIVLKTAAGAVVESFSAASSSRISIAGSTLTVDPSANLADGTHYYLSFAAGTVKDLAGNAYAGSNSYDFTTVSSNAGAFNINVIYSGDLSYKTYFDQAKAMWEKVIVGDLPSVNGIDDLQITVQVSAIDGVGGILGQAGPTGLRYQSDLPYLGNMEFDAADLANMVSDGTLTDVIAHEIGHVLGFGTIWADLGLNSSFGRYTGSHALAEYRTLSGNGAATYVPLETGGGAGTNNAHWAENVFGAELMTGYADHANLPLSRLTIAAMEDLGYQVNYAAAGAYALASLKVQASLVGLSTLGNLAYSIHGLA